MGLGVYDCSLCNEEMVARSHSQEHSKIKTTLYYIKPYLKKQQQQKIKPKNN